MKFKLTFSLVFTLIFCFLISGDAYAQGVTATATGLTNPTIANKGDESITLVVTFGGKIEAAQYTVYVSSLSPTGIEGVTGSGGTAGALARADFSDALVLPYLTKVGEITLLVNGATYMWNADGTGCLLDAWDGAGGYTGVGPGVLEPGSYYIYFVEETVTDQVDETGPITITRAVFSGTVANTTPQRSTIVDITWSDDGGTGSIKIYKAASGAYTNISDITTNGTLLTTVAESDASSYTYDVSAIADATTFYLYAVNDVPDEAASFDISSEITITALTFTEPKNADDVVNTNGDPATVSRYEFNITWTDDEEASSDRIGLYYSTSNTLTLTEVEALPAAQQISIDVMNPDDYANFYWTIATDAVTNDGIADSAYYIYAVQKITSGLDTYKRLSLSDDPVTITHDPFISVTEPDGTGDDGTLVSFDITWSDRDFDENSSVSLYYAATSGYTAVSDVTTNGTLITTITAGEDPVETAVDATAIIVAVAKADIVDEEVFTLTDATATAKTFGLDVAGNGTPSDVDIDISSATTAIEVAAVIVTAITNDGTFTAVQNASPNDAVVTVTQSAAGDDGNQTNSESVSGASYLTNFTGGADATTDAHTYEWDILSVDAGTYYVYGIIDSAVVDEAPSEIVINHPPRVELSLPTDNTSTAAFNLSSQKTMPIKWTDGDPDNTDPGDQVITIYITNDAGVLRAAIESKTIGEDKSGRVGSGADDVSQSDWDAFFGATADWHVITIIDGLNDGLGNDNYDWNVRSYINDSTTATPDILGGAGGTGFKILIVMESGGGTAFDISADADAVTFPAGNQSLKLFTPADDITVRDGETFQFQYEASSMATTNGGIMLVLVDQAEDNSSVSYGLGAPKITDLNANDDYYIINGRENDGATVPNLAGANITFTSVAGAGIGDGEIITLKDYDGNDVVFEVDLQPLDDGVTPGYVDMNITSAETQGNVAIEIQTAIDGEAEFNATVSVNDVTVELAIPGIGGNGVGDNTTDIVGIAAPAANFDNADKYYGASITPEAGTFDWEVKIDRGVPGPPDWVGEGPIANWDATDYAKTWVVYAFLDKSVAGGWDLADQVNSKAIGTIKILPNAAAGNEEIYITPSSITLVNSGEQTFTIKASQASDQSINIIDVHLSFSAADFEAVYTDLFFTPLTGATAFGAAGAEVSVNSITLDAGSNTYYMNFQVTNATAQDLSGTARSLATFTLRAKDVAEYSPVPGKLRIENDAGNNRQTKLYAGAAVIFPNLPPNGGVNISITPRGSIKGQVLFQAKTAHEEAVRLELREAGGSVPITDSTFISANDAVSGVEVSDAGVVSMTLSGMSGDFELLTVPPGTYDLVVAAPGYLRGHQNNIAVRPGEHITGVTPVHHYEIVATVYSEVTTNTKMIAGDLTGADNKQDNNIDSDDRAHIMSTDIYMKLVSVSGADSADFNDDGIVNVEDLAYVFANADLRGRVSLMKGEKGGDNSNAIISLDIKPVSGSSNEYIMKVIGKDFEDVRAYGFTIKYDPDVIKINADYLTCGDFFAEIESDGLVRIRNSEEVVVASSIIGNAGVGLRGDGVLMTARFTKISNEEVDFEISDPILINSAIEGVNLESIITAVEEIKALPTEFSLKQNYPNPFNPTTTIEFTLPQTSNVQLLIYNIQGQLVRTMNNGQMSAGYYSVIWDARSDLGVPVSSGVYIYRLKAGKNIFTKKMLFMK